MWFGLFCGIATGALWGLTFVAPRAVAPYGEVDLAIFRYLAFGLVSLGLMVGSARFRPGPITTERLLAALWLGFSGYVIYYLLIAFAIRYAGPAIPPLIIGALPVVLALIGNASERVVPWRALLLPLGLIAAGLIMVKSGSLAGAASAAEQGGIWFGGFLAFLALASWSAYAVLNAKIMRGHDAPAALPWTCLQGLGAMAGIIPLAIVAPLAGWSRMPDLGLWNPDFLRLIVWALVTGVLGSWIAQYLWTVASHRLPLALSAQLIVSETLFALIYGFVYEARWPRSYEWAGTALLVAGVIIGVQAFQRGRGPTKAAIGEHG
jgi:drug/metabolite transporter (DMT)-like permease